jgi:hypothetical protein
MVTGSLAFVIGVILVGFVFAWVISSLSVYIAARIIGVQVPFLRTLLVTLIADIISSIMSLIIMAGLLKSNLALIIIGSIIDFVIVLIIYKYLFKIDWTKTFIMLIIAGVIFFGILIILSIILAIVGLLVVFSIFSNLQAVH